MTTKTSDTQQNFLAAGGHDSLKSGLITCTLTGKNCAVPSLRRDTLSAKVQGLLPALTSGNAYYHNRRAVSLNECAICTLITFMNPAFYYLCINIKIPC